MVLIRMSWEFERTWMLVVKLRIAICVYDKWNEV